LVWQRSWVVMHAQLASIVTLMVQSDLLVK
jgi:hypothetical protein